ncbi:MAG: phosphoribosylglycinamide formyltransferase [Spirochaetales bacterium]|nr:phosphoribosylglycinamide formyltransferase [Spirochaetales bacterium]
MHRLAVLSSGNGSNFKAIAEKLAESDHTLACMICDRREALVFEKAGKLGIPAYYVNYMGRPRSVVEEEIGAVLKKEKVELIALAGFMRLLSPALIDLYESRILNIHPSLLPKYPGTQGIQESFNSTDEELGITIHHIDYGLDTGPVIMQKSFIRQGDETLEEIESRIHDLEHIWYPAVLLEILNSIP